jgi:hypothetical protein
MATHPETWKHRKKSDADLRLSLDACHGIAEKQVNAVTMVEGQSTRTTFTRTTPFRSIPSFLAAA